MIFVDCLKAIPVGNNCFTFVLNWSLLYSNLFPISFYSPLEWCLPLAYIYTCSELCCPCFLESNVLKKLNPNTRHLGLIRKLLFSVFVYILFVCFFLIIMSIISSCPNTNKLKFWLSLVKPFCYLICGKEVLKNHLPYCYFFTLSVYWQGRSKWKHLNEWLRYKRNVLESSHSKKAQIEMFNSEVGFSLGIHTNLLCSSMEFSF